MLTKKQIKEIREHLEKAQNPIFFFDKDPEDFAHFFYCKDLLKEARVLQLDLIQKWMLDILKELKN